LLDHTAIMALAIEGSGTGIWDRDVVSGEIDYSRGWKAMLGYGESELGRRIEESYTRVHPDDLASVQAAMQAHFEQKVDHNAVEHRIRCKDGSYKWISSRGRVIMRDDNGKALRMVGTSTDITAMRTLSEQLQYSVDLITSLTNEVPGLVFQYRRLPNGKGFFSYVSEGIENIYELTAAQVMNDASLTQQMLHPDDLHDYLVSRDTSAEMLTPWHLEYRVVLPRQGLRWRQGDAQPRKLEDDSIVWHGFITDITDRKRIEIEMQEFATIDFLTQLPNRRYFMTRMEEELARLQRISGSRAAV
jgi:PAS domain S-box-containing protein